MTSSTEDPATYWENRYATNGRSWSGNVNAALEREIAGVKPGSALDLGCGEGGDALWLAHRGWSVTAVDISPTALAIAAASQQPGDDITWVAADLAVWHPSGSYDLVTACFLHSEVELPREEIIRRSAAAVAPGGVLLIVGHFETTPRGHSPNHPHPDLLLPTPDQMLQSLLGSESTLRPEDWEVVTSALVERTAALPDGAVVPVTDSVVRLRRR